MQYSDFEKKLHSCKNKNILLGFSGGADSCALFLILAYWHKKIPFKFTAVHFEHGLRGNDSLSDADFCEKKAAEYQIDFQKYHLNVPENMLKNETVEAAARRLRLTKWQEICQNMTDFEIHLAHHANDLTENVLLRLFRGANASGLSGLREFTTVGNLPVRRIMLDFSRQEIEEFLQQENFGEYCTDKSNFDCTIGRNFLRNKVLKDIEKVFPYAAKGILRSAAVCEKDAEFIEQCAAQKYAEISSCNEVSNDFYKQLPPALSVRVLRSYFSRKLQYEYIPDWNFMQRFEEAVQNENASFMLKLELDSEHFYIRCNNLWHIEKREIPQPTAVIWDCLKNPETVFCNFKYTANIVEKITADNGKYYFALDELTLPLKISSRVEGESFEKFGGTHSTVKKELTDRKIHGFERDKVGILRNGSGEILLIGDFRRSSFAAVCSKNQKIIEITVEKLKN